MDSFRRQNINNLIFMSTKFIGGEVLDIGGTNNTKNIFCLHSQRIQAKKLSSI